MDSPNGQEPPKARRPRADETRLLLLRAAAELIGEVGWGRVTTRAVAERAGVPHGAVSYHFHGKEELLADAVMQLFEDTFPLDRIEAMTQLGEVADLFEPWLAELSSQDQLISRVGVEAMLQADRNPRLAEQLRTLLAGFRAVTAELIRSAQERGQLPAGASPEALAVLLSALGDGLFLHARLDPELDMAGALSALRSFLGAD